MGVDLTPSRYPSRASKNIEQINEVLDAGLFCTLSFLRDHLPHQLPTGYCRVDRALYIHASAKSRFIETIAGQTVSFSVTLMDGMVLSDTAFDHSFNYRSVIGFSEAERVLDPVKKTDLLKRFTDRYVPGRIADVGDPTPEQVHATHVIRLDLANVALKQRAGGTGLKKDAYKSWVGVIPLETKWGTPLDDPQNTLSPDLPPYISDIVSG